ncbi:MAG: hypothetical protein WBL44_07790 [Nitrososphaeraceae archaeon]|jgi:hypothetical protein
MMLNSISSMKRIVGILSVAILTTVLASGVFALLPTADDGDNYIANAQVVDVDEPPTNATEELDVKIDATEPLPANGTLVVDISGADDIDIDTIPPHGVSIIVTNSTVTVTNNPVEIVGAGATGAVPETQPGTAAGLDASTSTTSSNENEAEGSSDGDDSDTSGNDGGDEPTNTDDSPEDEGEEEEE